MRPSSSPVRPSNALEPMSHAERAAQSTSLGQRDERWRNTVNGIARGNPERCDGSEGIWSESRLHSREPRLRPDGNGQSADQGKGCAGLCEVGADLA